MIHRRILALYMALLLLPSICAAEDLPVPPTLPKPPGNVAIQNQVRNNPFALRPKPPSNPLGHSVSEPDPQGEVDSQSTATAVEPLPPAPRDNVSLTPPGRSQDRPPRTPAQPAAPVPSGGMLPFQSQRDIGPSPEDLVVLPGITTAVTLSSSDTNWIKCQNGSIQDMVTSQEKGVTVKYTSGNGFLKFQAAKSGDKILYATNPVELFVVCSDDVYKLIVQPALVHSATIVLGTRQSERVTTNRTALSGMPWESKILSLIREAYFGTFPDTYRYVPSGEVVSFSSAASLQKTGTYFIDGEGLAVHEFVLTNGSDSIVVDESMLLSRDLKTDGVKAALAIETNTLEPGQSTRVFVVTLGSSDTPEASMEGDLMKGWTK